MFRRLVSAVVVVLVVPGWIAGSDYPLWADVLLGVLWMVILVEQAREVTALLREQRK